MAIIIKHKHSPVLLHEWSFLDWASVHSDIEQEKKGGKKIIFFFCFWGPLLCGKFTEADNEEYIVFSILALPTQDSCLF